MVFLGFSKSKCSSFEEVVYQNNLYNPGLLNAILTGKHVNWCWWVVFGKHWRDYLSTFFTCTCNSVLAHTDDRYSCSLDGVSNIKVTANNL